MLSFSIILASTYPTHNSKADVLATTVYHRAILGFIHNICNLFPGRVTHSPLWTAANTGSCTHLPFTPRTNEILKYQCEQRKVKHLLSFYSSTHRSANSLQLPSVNGAFPFTQGWLLSVWWSEWEQHDFPLCSGGRQPQWQSESITSIFCHTYRWVM